MSTPGLKELAETSRKVATGAMLRSLDVLRPLDVLLIEDNADDALLLERHLRRNGFDPHVVRVDTASAMRQELLPEQEDKERSRVVLADYNLPNFSGPEALKILKASGIDLPFIMMSGAVSEEAAVESMRAGAQDYVTKQNLTRLVPAIERELREASARRKRVVAELALQASQARFHRLVEAMPLGLLIAQSTGEILYANHAVERMLGYTAAEVAVGSAAVAGGVTLQAISVTLQATISRATEDGFPPAAPFEAVCVTADRQNLDVLIGIALLNPEETPASWQVAAFIADLSRQKKSEEVLRQTEKLAVAGRLAASIAHEINNPLEAITNCLYLMECSELAAEARTYLTMAQKELDRVSKITMQTLRFYRRSTRPQRTDVRELVESVLGLMEPRLSQQEIAVKSDFRPIPLVIAHDGEIRQVLANLVGNAIDALATGGRLVLRVASAVDWKTGAPGVKVTVADNGTGMDEAVRSRIFEPFFSTKGITGTGLGLWISREIVEKHHGYLRVWSSKSRHGVAGGTVFALFLPLDDGHTIPAP